MGRVLFSIYIWACYIILFLFFFVVISLTFLITFPFDKYRRIPNKVLGVLAALLLRLSPGWKMQIQGTHNYDASEPTIFIANHESFLDIPLLYELPWKMKWVVKHSMTYIPVMGWLVKLTGQLTINRASKSSLKKLSNLVQPLKDLVPVMIFPEGTRSLNGEIQSFKNGAFLLALEHGFNIQPIVVSGPFQILKSGSKLFSSKATLKLSVLEPIDVTKFDSMTDLKDHARRLIIEEQKRLRNS